MPRILIRGTSLRRVAVGGLSLATGLAAAIAAGCGGVTKPVEARSAQARSAQARSAQAAAPASAPASASGASFAWLRPAAPPAGWRQLPIPNGATMSIPPGWRHVHGDRGTTSAILGGEADGANSGRVLGYLNVTPRQGPETLANWAHYRTHAISMYRAPVLVE